MGLRRVPLSELNGTEAAETSRIHSRDTQKPKQRRNKTDDAHPHKQQFTRYQRGRGRGVVAAGGGHMLREDGRGVNT